MILEKELKGIREICKDNNFSEEELLHRARLLYFINRLDFGKELPILLELIKYEVEKKKLKLPSEDDVKRKMIELKLDGNERDGFYQFYKWMRQLLLAVDENN